MSLTSLVGVSGYAQSGKDTLAQMICDTYPGYRIAHFADTLRLACAALNPIVGYRPRRDGTGIEAVRWSQLIQEVGYEAAKAHPRWGEEFRGTAQRMGTDAGRNLLGEDLWVDAAMKDVNPGDRIVFADVRFPNEMRAIQRRGGLMIRVSRPDLGPVNRHVSETALDGVRMPVRITNDQGPAWMLEQLQEQTQGRRAA